MTEQIVSLRSDPKLAVAACVLAFTLAVPASATGQVQHGVSTFVCVDTFNLCDDTPRNTFFIALNPTEPRITNRMFVTPDFSISYLTELESGFGVYRSSTTASYDGALTSAVNAQATSLEELTIDAGGLDGMPGLLQLTWSIDGTMTSSGASQALLGIQDCLVALGSIPLFGPPPFSPAPAGCQFRLFISSAPAVFTYPSPFQFTFGQPFTWRSVFLTSTNFTGAGSAQSDFFNTIVLSGLRVFTPAMTEVLDATFTSGSATEYSSRGVIPRPRAIALALDEDSIDNGTQAIEKLSFNPPYCGGPAPGPGNPSVCVNDDVARPGLRTLLFTRPSAVTPRKGVVLSTGRVGDEGLFGFTRPNPQVSRQNGAAFTIQEFVSSVGAAANENNLDKVDGVAPLGAAEIFALTGKTVCAVVFDSDVSVTSVQPPSASLKGATLGVTAFKVVAVTSSPFGGSYLPDITVDLLSSADALSVCQAVEPLR